MKAAKRIACCILIIINIICLCSCSSSDNVIEDNILTLAAEDDYFEFYYRKKIATLTARNEDYKIMHLSYDLNDDGTDEDICFIVSDTSDDVEIDIYDTNEGANIGAKTTITPDSNDKVQILKHKTKGYHDLKYVFVSDSGKVEDAVIMRMTVTDNTGYYTEAKK